MDASLNASAGVGIESVDCLALGLDYFGRVAEDERSHTGTARLSYRFRCVFMLGMRVNVAYSGRRRPP